MSRYKKLSTKPDPEFPFKGSGKYFRTQEEATAYSDHMNLVRRAQRAGFGTSIKELQEYKRAEEKRLEIAERDRRIKETERAERDRIREMYNLHPRAHVTGKQAAIAVRTESAKFVAKRNLLRMSEGQKLDAIRKLYSLNISEKELVQRIALIVGAAR